MAYVDGYVLAVRKDRLDDYKAMATQGAAIWKEYGALAYVECVADDVPYGELTSFPRAVQATDEETVIFAYIVYESREQRDEINAKVMVDPRMHMELGDMPFDGKRMIVGGFTPIVTA
ncbi:MAG TPA: DUF1428 family protein [Phenylobacterium sp.]